jgi:fimbrial chaperone protein
MTSMLREQRGSRSLVLTASLFLFIFAQTTAASGFSVSPVRVQLKAAGEIATMTVRNEALVDTVVQVDPLRWSAAAMEETLEPTEDLLVSPPIFRLPAGATQIVRVALRSAPDAERELSYRLLLSEVPQHRPVAPGQLRVALRISVPLFVEARSPAAASLEWTAQRLPGGRLEVEALNSGTAHVRLTGIQIADTTYDIPPVHVTQPVYLLPGQRRRWELSAATLMAATTGELRITARSANDALFDAVVPVAAPWRMGALAPDPFE